MKLIRILSNWLKLIVMTRLLKLFILLLHNNVLLYLSGWKKVNNNRTNTNTSYLAE